MAYGPPQSTFTSQTPDGSGGVIGSYGNDVTFTVAGRITGLRYYRPASSAGAASRTMRAWQGPTPGTLLGTASTSGDSAGGWYTASLGTPITVTAGQTLRVCTCPTSGSDRLARFNANSGAIINGDLAMAIASFGLSGAENVAVYPPDSGVFGTRLYFTDVVFEALLAPTGGRPKVYIGGSWQTKPAKVYAGGTWTEKPMKRHNGTTWVPIT